MHNLAILESNVNLQSPEPSGLRYPCFNYKKTTKRQKLPMASCKKLSLRLPSPRSDEATHTPRRRSKGATTAAAYDDEDCSDGSSSDREDERTDEDNNLRDLLMSSPSTFMRRVFLGSASASVSSSSSAFTFAEGDARDNRFEQPPTNKTTGKKQKQKQKQRRAGWVVNFGASRWVVLSSCLFTVPVLYASSGGLRMLPLPLAVRQVPIAYMLGLHSQSSNTVHTPNAVTYFLAIVSALTAILSAQHWWRAREHSLQRALDLVWCKVSALFYASIGCFYAGTDATVWLLGVLGCVLMAAGYSFSGSQFDAGNKYWFVFHMLFHCAVVCTQMLVLHTVFTNE